MKKDVSIGKWIVLGAVILIALGVFIGFKSFTGSSTTPAFLFTDGTVQVNTGSGWQDAITEMVLHEGDVIKTISGTAEIVLFEGAIVTLAQDSEVQLQKLSKSNVQLHLARGNVWNQVTDITGERTVSISTDDGIITALGTAFNVAADGTIFVGEGSVQVESTSGETRNVHEFKKVRLIRNSIVRAKLTGREYTQIKGNVRGDIQTLKDLRWREARKHQMLLDQAMDKGVTEEDINKILEKLDSGEMSIDEVLEKIPIKVSFIDKLVKITEEIIELRKQLLEMDEM